MIIVLQKKSMKPWGRSLNSMNYIYIYIYIYIYCVYGSVIGLAFFNKFHLNETCLKKPNLKIGTTYKKHLFSTIIGI